jgi:hypothetical protein
MRWLTKPKATVWRLDSNEEREPNIDRPVTATVETAKMKMATRTSVNAKPGDDLMQKVYHSLWEELRTKPKSVDRREEIRYTGSTLFPV